MNFHKFKFLFIGFLFIASIGVQGCSGNSDTATAPGEDTSPDEGDGVVEFKTKNLSLNMTKVTLTPQESALTITGAAASFTSTDGSTMTCSGGIIQAAVGTTTPVSADLSADCSFQLKVTATHGDTVLLSVTSTTGSTAKTKTSVSKETAETSTQVAQFTSPASEESLQDATLQTSTVIRFSGLTANAAYSICDTGESSGSSSDLPACVSSSSGCIQVTSNKDGDVLALLPIGRQYQLLVGDGTCKYQTAFTDAQVEQIETKIQNDYQAAAQAAADTGITGTVSGSGNPDAESSDDSSYKDIQIKVLFGNDNPDTHGLGAPSGSTGVSYRYNNLINNELNTQQKVSALSGGGVIMEESVSYWPYAASIAQNTSPYKCRVTNVLYDPNARSPWIYAIRQVQDMVSTITPDVYVAVNGYTVDINPVNLKVTSMELATLCATSNEFTTDIADPNSSFIQLNKVPVFSIYVVADPEGNASGDKQAAGFTFPQGAGIASATVTVRVDIKDLVPDDCNTTKNVALRSTSPCGGESGDGSDGGGDSNGGGMEGESGGESGGSSSGESSGGGSADNTGEDDQNQNACVTTADADGDGYPNAGSTSLPLIVDCDDTNPGIKPTATQIPCNLIDEQTCASVPASDKIYIGDRQHYVTCSDFNRICGYSYTTTTQLSPGVCQAGGTLVWNDESAKVTVHYTSPPCLSNCDSEQMPCSSVLFMGTAP